MKRLTRAILDDYEIERSAPDEVFDRNIVEEAIGLHVGDLVAEGIHAVDAKVPVDVALLILRPELALDAVHQNEMSLRAGGKVDQPHDGLDVFAVIADGHVALAGVLRDDARLAVRDV